MIWCFAAAEVVFGIASLCSLVHNRQRMGYWLLACCAGSCVGLMLS
jgi:hypothetical protein